MFLKRNIHDLQASDKANVIQPAGLLSSARKYDKQLRRENTGKLVLIEEHLNL